MVNDTERNVIAKNVKREKIKNGGVKMENSEFISKINESLNLLCEIQKLIKLLEDLKKSIMVSLVF